jgi:hypothetical protein
MVRMEKPAVILFLFLLLFSGTSAQEIPCSDSLRERVERIPDSVTRDPGMFAIYLHSVFPADDCAAKALYIWLARYMYYDPGMIANPPKYSGPEEMVMQTLANRKGVCSNYAELFRNIMARLGIPAVTVIGYTRSETGVDTKTGHAWNAVFIDNKWRLIDATWGGGYLKEGKYFRKFSLDYFMPPADSMILDHMPFDPIWQLRPDPLTHREFLEGIPSSSSGFSYNDSISEWLSLDTCARTYAAERRCEIYGISAPVLDFLKNKYYTELRNDRFNYSLLRFNRATGMFNLLSDSYNSLARAVNENSMDREQQKNALAILEKELDSFNSMMTDRGCPDQELSLYWDRLGSGLDALKKFIRRMAGQINP